MSKATADKINQKNEDEGQTKQVVATSGMVQKDVDESHNPPRKGDFRKGGDYEQSLTDWYNFVEKYEERCKTTTDEEVKLVIDFIHTNRDNNFIFNASNMIKNGSVQKHLLYYITGACSWYFGKLSQEDRKKREESESINGKKESEWIGKIGEKTKLENLEVVHIGGFDGGYGWTNVYKLKDQNGNNFTKFGTIGNQFIVKKSNKQSNEILVGDVISATAEIKKHDEYMGKKQTVLGRLSKL
jgi:hypothetical protein